MEAPVKEHEAGRMCVLEYFTFPIERNVCFFHACHVVSRVSGLFTFPIEGRVTFWRQKTRKT